MSNFVLSSNKKIVYSGWGGFKYVHKTDAEKVGGVGQHHWVATGERRLANNNLQNRKSTIKLKTHIRLWIQSEHTQEHQVLPETRTIQH